MQANDLGDVRSRIDVFWILTIQLSSLLLFLYSSGERHGLRKDVGHALASFFGVAVAFQEQQCVPIEVDNGANRSGSRGRHGGSAVA